MWNLKNMESHLVYATNNHSSQYEHRFELNSQSYMSESQGFESEGGKSHYDQFERSFHEGSLLFHQQTFSPYSNICYVGNNETVFIQPPSFNGCHSADKIWALIKDISTFIRFIMVLWTLSSLMTHETILVKEIPRFKAWVGSGSITNTVVITEDGALA